MGKKDTASFEIDVTGYIPDEIMRGLAARREAFLASLSPDERAHEEAKSAAEERLIEEDERAYEEIVRTAERAASVRHRQIMTDRKAGLVGTLTEIGRPFGISAIEAGRILKRHGLRELVDVPDDKGDPVAVATRRYEDEKRRRWAEFNARFRPNKTPDTTPTENAQGPERCIRGIVDGFAIEDHFDRREYWIAAKVAPLLEADIKAGLT